jgi:hypothetical protein
MRPGAEKGNRSTEVGHRRDDDQKDQKSLRHAAMSLAIEARPN